MQYTTALTELRDALDDAIRRAYCEPVPPPVEGEDEALVRSMNQTAVVSSPPIMRHLAGIQAAAWRVVEERVVDEAQA